MKTLLLADHHAPTREHVAVALAQAGFEVRGIDEPGAALEHFVAGRPDGVVIAVDFPKLKGSHLGKLIRATDRGARVPLVILDRGHLGRAKGVSSILDLKADGYIADPTKTHELIDKLRALFAASQARAAEAVRGIDITLSRSPQATGELRAGLAMQHGTSTWSAGLPTALHACFRERKSGILVVAFRELTRRVFLLQGRPMHYESTARQDSFPNFLVETGDLKPEHADRVLRLLISGQPVGAALYHAGVKAKGEALLQKLRDYLQAKVAQVVGMREGRFAFFAGTEFAKEIPTIEIPALAPIHDGARRAYPVKVFAQALKPFSNSFPQRSADFSRDLAALGLDTQDLKIAMQMNGRIPLRELIAHGRGDLRRSYALFWFLNLAGDVVFAPSPSGAASGERIGPRKKKPIPAETLTRLRDQAVKIITGSYFKVLGLDIGATSADVEEAYHRLGEEFHLDTYAEYDESSFQDLLESVQDKLAASYRVLSNEERRKAYVRYLLSRLDVRVAAVNAEAEIALKRGESALRRKDLQGALKSFEQAVTLNPREPEYYSYLAWATFQGGEGDKAARAKAAQKLIKKAVGLNAYLERPLVISAIIDAEMGDSEAAKKKIAKVLEMNPSSQLANATLKRVGK
ncbi:MAG: DUF4388 domain-containing protein [Myxococcaceae bacterium]